MSIYTEKKLIQWDEVLANYGEETKQALMRLLMESDVDEHDPAAAVIAGMFLALRDVNQNFAAISSVVSTGKVDLEKAFTDQILKLRGIISYAQELLVQEQGRLDKQAQAFAIEGQEKLYESVKNGVTKAVLQHDRQAGNRTATFYVLCVLGTFAVSIASATVGALGVRWLSLPSAPVDAGEIDDRLVRVVASNAETLSTCIENRVRLAQKCVIEIPQGVN